MSVTENQAAASLDETEEELKNSSASVGDNASHNVQSVVETRDANAALSNPPDAGFNPVAPIGEFTLDTTAAVKARVREFSERNETYATAILGGMLFACWLSFGWLASTTAILLICMLILLTKLTKLSNKSQVQIVGEKLNITLIDLLGKSTLSISKRQIKSIKESETGFEIEPESTFLNLAQRLVFKSLFQAKTNPAIIRIPFEGLADAQQKKNLREALGQFIGSDIEKKQVALPPPPVEDGVIRVAYSPNRIARENAARWMRKNNWKVSLILFAVGLSITLALGISQTFVVLMIAGLIAFLSALHEKEKPNTLAFSADGIAFMWRRKTGETSTSVIPWDCLKMVAASEPSTRKEFDTIIDFALEAEKISGAKLNSMLLMLPEYFDKSANLKLRLRAGGLEGVDARHDLFNAIKKFVPADKVLPGVAKALNPTDADSYTKLWLDSMGAAPRRLAEGHLFNGHILDNGRFEVVRLLGAGGQATAYLAKERFAEGEQLQERTIVLKEFILPAHAGAELSARSLDNVRKEYDLIKRIHNPHIVEYLGLFVEDHRAYLVLEHIDGPSLREYVTQQGTLTEEKVVDLAKQMCEILAYLHNQSPPVVHRDFTPENLMLTADGKLKLIDFNVAQELENEVTRKTIVGKHSYIPQEQFRGKPTPQSDIYAMGATLFYLLTGEDPEPIMSSNPILKRPQISPELNELVAKATQSTLAKRYAKAEDLKVDLEKIVVEKPSKTDDDLTAL